MIQIDADGIYQRITLEQAMDISIELQSLVAIGVRFREEQEKARKATP